MDIDALRDAVLKGAQGGNAAAPMATPGLDQLFASSAALPLSNALTAESAGIAQEKVDAQKAAAAAAEKAAAEAKQREADLSDPSKYRAVRKEDGGFDYFAPDGSQVDIATLTQRTGTRPIDWLSSEKWGTSENPIDIQYINDQKNLNDFINALASKDTDTISKFQNSDPNLKRYTSDRGGIDALMKDFNKVYQRYYVPRTVNRQAWGTTPSRVVVPTPGGVSGSYAQNYGTNSGGGGIAL